MLAVLSAGDSSDAEDDCVSVKSSQASRWSNKYEVPIAPARRLETLLFQDDQDQSDCPFVSDDLPRFKRHLRRDLFSTSIQRSLRMLSFWKPVLGNIIHFPCELIQFG